MFNVRQPFYQAEGTEGGTWFDALRDAVPADEEQTQEESDAESEGEQQETAEMADEKDETTAADGDETDEEDQTQDQQPAFTDDTEVDLGEGRQPVKLSELKSGYLRQSDYTKKTQELATQRKELEATLEQVKPAQELHQFFQSNPYVHQQVISAIQEYLNTGVLPIQEVLADAQYSQYVNHYMAENKRLSDRVSELEAKAGELELSTTFTSLRNDLRAEYGNLVTDEYISSLQDRAKAENLPQTLIRDIAEAHLAKEALKQARTQGKTATKQVEAKTVQSLQESRRKSPPQPKSQGQRPSKDDVPTDGSWFEALRAAARR